MNKIIGYPKVVLVGRTNVGKSTLFNRLAETERSIIFDRDGVTRDYIHEVMSWKDKTFDLVDTGGLPLKKTSDTIVQGIQKSVYDLLEQAELLLFVVDGKNGLTEEDRRIAKIIHKSKKPTLLLINKADNRKAFEENVSDFFKLGFKEIMDTSAMHGIGIDELLDWVVKHVSDKKVLHEEPIYGVTILGKPNAGKSSLMNLLIKQDRAIISEIAGTTREAISEQIRFQKELIQITDTAGVRRKSKIGDPLEEIMVKSSLKSVRESEIVILVIDASFGTITDQELKLLFYAKEQKKSIILVLNKTDIMDDNKFAMMELRLQEYDFFFRNVPILFVSCETQKNVGSVFKEIKRARKRRTQKFDQLEVDEFIKESCIRRPMYHKTNLLRIYRIKVVAASLPTIILYVNYPEWFGETQLGFLENGLRKKYDLLGCPINLITRKAASY